jgi:hypothetical protein
MATESFQLDVGDRSNNAKIISGMWVEEIGPSKGKAIKMVVE